VKTNFLELGTLPNTLSASLPH